MLTGQEILNIVVSRLRVQGKLSFEERSSGGVCLYRSADGSKCAAGLLIEDHEYQPWMDSGNYPIGSLLRDPRCPSSLKERLLPHLSLIVKLQAIHDNGTGLQPKALSSYWELGWSDVALHSGLTLPPKE